MYVPINILIMCLININIKKPELGQDPSTAFCKKKTENNLPKVVCDLPIVVCDLHL